MNESREKQTPQKKPFSVALTYLLNHMERGTAASIAKEIGVKPAFISEIASGKKNGREDTRRKIAKALRLPYEHFLALGEFLLVGTPGEEALETVRAAVASGSIVRPIPRTGIHPATPDNVGAASATQNGGVNNGTLAGVVNNAMPFNSLHSQGGDEKRRNFDQTLTGWFAGVCDWWATEHGTDSSSPSAFFREFDRRFPEYVAWSRIEKK